LFTSHVLTPYFSVMFARPHLFTLFPYTTLFRSWIVYGLLALTILLLVAVFGFSPINGARRWIKLRGFSIQPSEIAKLSLALFLADRKSTRLNSSHVSISYAVFCLKKKTK